MRLVRLRVDGLPGIQRGFELTDLGPGINVIVGPNASGKSSLVRAVRALLYEEELKGERVLVEGVFQDAAGQLVARRTLDRLEWRRDGREVAPKLLPRNLVTCYALAVEDLTASGATDEEIGKEISTALRGGYDLAALRGSRPLKLKANHAQAEHHDLLDARNELSKVERRQAELLRAQGQITHWTEEVAAAERARHEVGALDSALALLDARRALQDLAGQLGAFPDGMELLIGDEDERLDALRDAQAARIRELDQAREARRAAEVALATSGLAESPLALADLEVWRAELRANRRLEVDVAGWEGKARDARAQLAAAERQLRSAPDTPSQANVAVLDDRTAPTLDPASLGRVDVALERKRTIDARIRRLDDGLAELPVEDGTALDRTRLQDARQALSEVLATPRSRRWWPTRGLGVLLSLGSVAAAAALAAIGGTAVLLVVGLAVLGAAGLALALRDDGATQARKGALERFRSTGVDAPATWDDPAMHRRLRELDEALARAGQRERRLEERRRLELRRQAAETELAGVEASLRPLADEVGFDPRNLDAGVQRWLRLLDAFDRATAELHRAEAALDELRTELGTRAASLEGFLAGHGVAGAGAAREADVLEARLETLAGRLARRDEARQRLERTVSDIDRIDRERVRSHDDLRTLLAGVGLEPRPDDDDARQAERELRRRLERLPAYRPLDGARREAEVLERDRAGGLAERPDLLAYVDADDRDGLEDARRVLERTVEAQRDAQRNITETETLIQKADRDRELAHARARRQAAHEALVDRVEEALRSRAGLLLLHEIENEYELSSQPAALRRASAWFQRFTRDQYELRFDGRSGTFSALETASGEERALRELSTGTRTQLLLAVRIAFATEAEEMSGAASLPIYLDEALTTADVDRFQAVGTSLGILAREGGRQLFYLTARPEDAALWRAGWGASGECDVRVIDLAQVRTGTATAAAAEVLALPPRMEPPSPEGLSPEAYAAALHVPPIDPWRPPEACHLFHLLRDDLPLLHRLVTANVDRLGTLRAFLDGPAAAPLLAAEERARLKDRVAGAVAYLTAWRRGRGRPVDRAALEDAEGVTPKMLDAVTELAEQLGGDANALLSALDGGGVAHFHRSMREKLSDWLMEHDYLDERSVLDEHELTQQVIVAMAPRDLDVGGADRLLDQARELALWLTIGIRAGKGGRGTPAADPSPAGAER